MREGQRYIYLLVCKKQYKEKCTLESLLSCLIHLKQHCKAVGVRNLAMPTIGFGRDDLY